MHVCEIIKMKKGEGVEQKRSKGEDKAQSKSVSVFTSALWHRNRAFNCTWFMCGPVQPAIWKCLHLWLSETLLLSTITIILQGSEIIKSQ